MVRVRIHPAALVYGKLCAYCQRDPSIALYSRAEPCCRIFNADEVFGTSWRLRRQDHRARACRLMGHGTRQRILIPLEKPLINT